ncbi:MAG: hypothetical protein LBI26_03420 [Holosporales bacterium]|jgi:hypothetical protein|nr:hypothetical protein [Holosporales bacterium]
MSEEIVVTFFKIHKCGFYRSGKKIFGSLEDLLPDLKKWAEAVQLMTETNLLGGETEDASGNEYRDIFYYDYCEANKNSLLVLWNRLPDILGSVPTLSVNRKTGDNTQCEITNLPKNSIPGTASYYWFLPEKNCFATIARKNKTSNVKGMKLYLQTFLATRSQHCSYEKKDDGNEIKGYIEPKKQKILTDVTPYFQASRATRKGQLEFITSNRTKIRKIIRKQKVTKELKSRQNIGRKLLIAMGLKNPKVENKEFNTSYEVAYTPTELELKELISEWEDSNATDYDDTGFVLIRDSKTHWLSGEISRIKKDWEVKYKDAEILEPQELLKLLNTYKDELLAVLK